MENQSLETNNMFEEMPGDKKITKYQWQTLWASFTGYAMDGLDMMILAFALPLISSDLGLNSAEAGFISTITLIGTVIGGYIFGALADIYGRVKIFSLTILIFSVFTGLCAIASNIFWLDLFRLLSGLGIGGEFGIGMTLVSETWSKKYRSRATAGVAVGFQVGIVLATICVMLIAPHFGWRGVFLIGVLPALFAWWSRRKLDEPELWKKSNQARKANDRKIPLKQLFDSPKRVGITLGLILITGVQNFGFYAIMTWSPTMLADQFNFSFSDTTSWTVVTTIGMILGIIVFGYLSDKWGRKPSYIIFQLASAIIVWIFFQQSAFALLLLLGAIMGFFVNGMMGGYGAWMAEHYSTEIRSTAENFIFNSGKGIAGFGPFIIGYLALKHSLSYSLGLISGIYFLAAIAVVLLIPETKGKELE